MTHPDELMKMIANLAREHGYGVTRLELVSSQLVNGVRADHSYATHPIEIRNMDGSGRVFTGMPESEREG